MNCTTRLLTSATACVFALLASNAVAATFTFDDIDYWIGAGANRAALAIDWTDASTDPPALVWGYRWDGTAYGRDMLAAILADDDRLFAKLGGTPSSPVAVYGLGYDANDDGQFALDDETSFDESGIAITGPADGSASLDPADYYAEGWFTGFWHYGQANVNPYDDGSWTSAPAGMSGRVLSDGAWDSWAFTNSTTPPFNAYATNPQPAASPYPPGDFDHDGSVTAADYDAWKNSFGSTSMLAADANKNGIVDAADYTIWRDQFATGAGPSAAMRLSVPEPSTLAIGSLGMFWQFFIRRKEKTP